MKTIGSFFLGILFSTLLAGQNLPPLATENVLERDVWANWQIPTSTPAFATLGEALDYTFDSIATLSPLKGFVATILFQDSTMWQRAAGLNAENPPEDLTLHTALGFGSATKMFTATVVHQLVSEGTLSLSDRLADWLPAFNNVDSNITIRQLLNHTSGLSNYTENVAFLFQAIIDFSHVWTPEEALLYQTPPFFAPGAGWYYSNTNYLLLSMVVEAATGIPFVTHVRNRIITPLNLSESFSFPAETPSVPIGHIWYDLNGDGESEDFQATGNSMNSIFSSLRGSAQLIGTTADLAVFIRNLTAGNLLSAEAQQNLLSFDSLASNQENGACYGLGITRRKLAGRTMLGHNGYVFHQTRAYHFPEENFSIAVQTNEGNQDSTLVNLDDLFASLALTTFQYVTPTAEPVEGGPLVVLFPNPANERFFALFTQEVDGTLALYRTDGAMVYSENFQNVLNLEISISDLPPGVYFWKYSSDKGKVEAAGRIVIVH